MYLEFTTASCIKRLSSYLRPISVYYCPDCPLRVLLLYLDYLLLHESAVNGKVGLGCQPTLSCVTHTQQHRATD